jgi:hypothetical protein
MRDQGVETLSQRIDSLSERVDTLGRRVEDLAETLQRLTSALSSNPLLAPGPFSEAGRAAPVPSETASVSGASRTSQYNQLAAEIPVVPDFCVALCNRLSAGTLSSRQRAERAWEAGYWARFVLEGRVQKPRPSVLCDVANTIYVVLRAPGYQCPLYVHSSGIYRAIVGNFKADTISHGFASQAEATIYCTGAGVTLPSAPYQWSHQQ